MGQTASRPKATTVCKGSKNLVVTCDSIWPTCANDNGVSRLLQGCLETRRRLGHGGHDNEYYEHINGISYLIHRKIGSGEYSEVYEASRINHAGHVERYAIKIYRSRSLERQKRMKEELKVLTKLGTYCNQIVRLHHYSEELDDETGVFELKLVLDLCLGKSLRHRIKHGPVLNERSVQIIALQLSQALHYLHTRRVVHCDVKPENVLFVDSVGLSIKLSDFGITKISHDGKSFPLCNSFDTSDIYLAPEIILEEPYGIQADMWSLGITLYHCLTNHLPFQHGTHLKMGVCQEIVSGSFIRHAFSATEFPESLSFDALRFIERLLRVDPNERLNVIEALNHRWLRGSLNDHCITTEENHYVSTSMLDQQQQQHLDQEEPQQSFLDNHNNNNNSYSSNNNTHNDSNGNHRHKLLSYEEEGLSSSSSSCLMQTTTASCSSSAFDNNHALGSTSTLSTPPPYEYLDEQHHHHPTTTAIDSNNNYFSSLQNTADKFDCSTTNFYSHSPKSLTRQQQRHTNYQEQKKSSCRRHSSKKIHNT